MARSTLMLFGMVLTLWGLFLMVGGMDSHKGTAATGGGGGGEIDGAGGHGSIFTGMDASAAPPHVLEEEGESSCPRATSDDTPTAEEGQASGGGNSDDAFRDLPDLSSGGRVPRLCQSTLLETFASSSQIGQPDLDMDKEMESESQGSAGDDEEQAEEEEQAEDAEGEHTMQGCRPAKRLRHFSGVGVSEWSTLTGDGPLEGYRRRLQPCFIFGPSLHVR